MGEMGTGIYLGKFTLGKWHLGHWDLESQTINMKLGLEFENVWETIG